MIAGIKQDNEGTKEVQIVDRRGRERKAGCMIDSDEKRLPERWTEEETVVIIQINTWGLCV